ncbi:GNAT family N-acetyltransferase [Salisediminibacterium selenitireducens]|uniref:GCN5-related N-acetyltransferase n=1 Tax=Bacillus selenitireducens (strain ATCC 700615 / DSM 15326 / MLS10) TaxID=439292 RepID=D6XZ29_BACIE|nr:GNAT family N-acetyltransferase [Salisediminibacterium selenitireducens]ADI00314.1 GCN5-related N-acetyltransferase [[Bacillus] selenitireducens MLS10]
MSVKIRETEPEDAGMLLAYLKQVGSETDHLLIDGNGVPMTENEEATFLSRIKADPGACMLAGFLGEELVAVASYQASDNQRIAHHAELAVSVKKACWGKGVGNAMIEALISEAKESGQIRHLHLKVKADNERAISLYRKLGFVETGRYPDFFLINGVYEDALLMHLALSV